MYRGASRTRLAGRVGYVSRQLLRGRRNALSRCLPNDGITWQVGLVSGGKEEENNGKGLRDELESDVKVTIAAVMP
jgi:hypothetical protein